jgi:pimeloyl-ACP methyl ester carboxylesterase
MMFIQGERDRLGPPAMIRRATQSVPAASLIVVADADHGFSVPKRTGLDQNDVLDLLADLTVGFIASATGD